MATSSVTSLPFALSSRGIDVVLEEIFTFLVVFWSDTNRQLQVPGGARVYFKHEMSHPPFFWESSLGPGTHTFILNEGWNKFKVRLESPAPATVVWIL